MKEYFGLKSILSFAWKNKFSQNLYKIVAISFFINLFILPVILYYFQQKNLLGNNLFHIPFTGLIYLPAVLLGFILFPLKSFVVIEMLYFALMQQLGTAWYWVIQKNYTLNAAIIEKVPFLELENSGLNTTFWVFYYFVLGGILFFYFKKS